MTGVISYVVFVSWGPNPQCVDFSRAQNNLFELTATVNAEYDRSTWFCIVGLFQCCQLQTPQNWPIGQSPVQQMSPKAQTDM